MTQSVHISMSNPWSDPLLKRNLCPECSFNLREGDERADHYINEWEKKNPSLLDELKQAVQAELQLSHKPSLAELAKLGDAFLGDRFHSSQPLFQGRSVLQKALEYIDAFTHFSKFNDHQYRVLTCSNLMKEIFHTIQHKLKNLDSSAKYVYYSLHDTNISPILFEMGMVDMDCIKKELEQPTGLKCLLKPDFMSSLLFELHTDDETQAASIKIRYNGSYLKQCKAKNSEECDLAEFYQLYDGLIYKEKYGCPAIAASSDEERRLQEAQDLEAARRAKEVITLVIQCICLILVVAIVYFHIQNYRQPPETKEQ